MRGRGRPLSSGARAAPIVDMPAVPPDGLGVLLVLIGTGVWDDTDPGLHHSIKTTPSRLPLPSPHPPAPILPYRTIEFIRIFTPDSQPGSGPGPSPEHPDSPLGLDRPAEIQPLPGRPNCGVSPAPFHRVEDLHEPLLPLLHAFKKGRGPAVSSRPVRVKGGKRAGGGPMGPPNNMSPQYPHTPGMR